MIPDMRLREETQEYRDAVRHFASTQILAIETVLHECGCFGTETMMTASLRARLDTERVYKEGLDDSRFSQG